MNAKANVALEPLPRNDCNPEIRKKNPFRMDTGYRVSIVDLTAFDMKDDEIMINYKNGGINQF